MGMIDSQLSLSAAQAMASSSTTTQSTNVIDLSIAGHFFNTERPMKLFLLWTGTPVGTSLRIDLRSGATAADLTSSPTIHWSSGIVPQATYSAVGWTASTATAPVVPAQIDLPNAGFNPGIQSTGGLYKQYLGLIFINVGDTSAGILTAWFGPAGSYDARNYPASGFTAPAVT